MSGERTRSSVLGSFSKTSAFYFRSMTDVEVENFKARRLGGELICNPMTSVSYKANKVLYPQANFMRETRYKLSPGVYSPWSGGRTYCSSYPSPLNRAYVYNSSGLNAYAIKSWINSRLGSGTTTWEPSQSLIDVVMTNLSAKLGSGVAQSLVSYAERAKTIKMVVKAMQILRRPFATAKRELGLTRRDLQTREGRSRLVQKAESLWMEARFGWRPLVYDIAGHVEGVLEPFTLRDTVRGTLSINPVHVEIPYAPYSNVWSPLSWQPTLICDGSFKCRLGQTGDYLVDFGALKTFGLIDPLGTAWELVTLSWAVDYFVNVSKVLQALQAFALVDERVGWTTTEVSATAGIKWDVVNGSMYAEYERRYDLKIPESQSSTEVAVLKQRKVVEDFTPKLGFRVDLDWKKVTDLGIVLHNFMRR